MNLDSGESPARARILRSRGFEVRFDGGRAWVECWVRDGDQSWCGRGTDAAEGLDDALRQMVPAARLRAWILRELDAATEPEPEPERAPEPQPEPEAIPGPGPAAEEAGPAAEEAGPAAGDVDPADEEADPPGAEASPSRVRVLGRVELPAGSAPQQHAEPDAGPREAQREQLRAILDDIRWAGPELGELAPRRMQLTFLIWIAEARAIASRFPGDDELEEDVHQVARALSNHAARFWPGSVPALRIDSDPAHSARTLRLIHGGRAPSTWTDLARRARAALEDDEAMASFDEDGWADARALEPPPSDPDARFARARDELIERTGPLDEAKPRERLHWSGTEPGADALLRLAGTLRWLRGATASPEAWGRAFGRLRCLGMHAREDWPALSEVLDRRYVPGESWAVELREARSQAEAEQQRQEQEARRRAAAAARRAAAVEELRATRPDGDAPPVRHRDWFVRAFEALDNPRILALLGIPEDGAEQVLERFPALSADDFDDARFRRRWRHLTQPSADADGDGEDDAAAREAAADAEGGAGGDAAADPDPHAPLRSAARRYTAGRRLLFVSNRKDPDLARRIERLLQPDSLDWSDNRDHALDAQAERVRSGSYDLVIAATGFLGHSTDQKLGSACKDAGVPYVRAARGRELACLRAILRDVAGIVDPTPEDLAGVRG